MVRRVRCIITYIVKRTQIYLDEDQDARLEAAARVSGSTKSSLIRSAIDAFFSRPRDVTSLEASLKATSGALPDLEVPSRDEWDRGHG
jgi:predicted DNA-binding protein